MHLHIHTMLCIQRAPLALESRIMHILMAHLNWRQDNVVDFLKMTPLLLFSCARCCRQFGTTWQTEDNNKVMSWLQSGKEVGSSKQEENDAMSWSESKVSLAWQKWC